MSRGRSRTTALAATSAVLVGTLLAACSAGSHPAAPSGSSGSSGSSAPVPSTGPGGSGPAADLTGLGGAPVGLAYTDGSVWAAVATTNQVARIDPATGAVVGTVRVGDTPLRLVATPHGLWVSEFGAGTVARIDTATGTVAARVAVGRQPEGLTTDGRHVWVVLQQDVRLVELDATTGAHVRSVALPEGGEPRLAAFAPAAPGRKATVWVLDFGADRIVPVDAASGLVGAPVAACSGPQALAVSGGTVWVACLSGRLVAVDLGSHRVRASVDLTAMDGPPDAVDGAGGTLYVALSTGPTLLSVDPVALRVTGLSRLGTAGPLTNADVDVLVAAGQVWVTSWNEQGVHHDPVGSLGPPP